MSKKIKANQLEANKKILVRGRIEFARVTRVIDGEELTKSVQKATAAGVMYPTDKPHTRIVLVDPVV